MKMIRSLYLAAILILIPAQVVAQATGSAPQALNVNPQPPILITSCGQSPGPAMLKALMPKPGVEVELNGLAAAADLKSGKYKTLIIVMGASLKGMGAAGIDISDELKRTAALIAEARNQKMTVIGAHIEGMKRRSQGAAEGDTTDEQSIDAVAPNSDLLLVYKEGDSDNRFTTISNGKKIPMIRFDRYPDLQAELRKLFVK